ncbi:hypothetical protein V7S43_010950 [Phytophthora oleae]|uniref:Pyrroline-5-carboxylate reductase catalytic N-terminal domain-containing protein n=1 Tax=Phytophthora oleae TaxID=2107226 RepID=A0ABD3FCP3_9STRA
MAAISPPSSPSGNGGTSNDAKNVKKPFKIRAELLAPTRLAPKAQLLHHTRSLSIQVIAHQVLLLVLACTKCYTAASKDPPRIGVLGGGSVGTAVVMTILTNGYRADRIALSTRQPDRIPRCEALKAPSALPMFQLVPRYYDNARLARESDILVLCMPPSQLKSVTIQIRHALAANVKTPPLVISTLCGVTQQSLTKACGSEVVVRVQPDVAKIASQWHEQQQAEEPVGSGAHIYVGLELNVAELHRDRQPLPLRLAAEAIAPQRVDIRDLVQAFALFCRRAWNESMGIEVPAHVLFGDKHEMVLTTLDQSVAETGSEQQNQEEEVVRAKTPLVVPSWPVEWEQDLAELQQQLVAHALQ